MIRSLRLFLLCLLCNLKVNSLTDRKSELKQQQLPSLTSIVMMHRARPKPRMLAYDFFMQTCEKEYKEEHPEVNLEDDDVACKEFSKTCAENWKTMLDEEKNRFYEMAENDSKRYDAELQNLLSPKGVETRGMKRKEIKKKVNQPKRSLSAFFWFTNEERNKVRTQHPEYNLGDIAKELGRRWIDASPEVKAKFEEVAEKDKQRFEEQQQLPSLTSIVMMHRARPKPRMLAYDFFMQTCEKEYKEEHPEVNLEDDDVACKEFSKTCAEKWKTMLDEEKNRFYEMAENDSKRYDAELQNLLSPKGVETRGMKRKEIKKKVNQPKRSLSAFFWFTNEERNKVRTQHPEYNLGDIAKELGRRWIDASPEVKAKFEEVAEKDKQRFEEEMAAYKNMEVESEDTDEDDGE